MKSNFLRRRWLDFRNGHSIYLAFILTFVNFILITYNFAIKQVTFFQGIFDNLFVFVLLFIGLYVPAAIIIGYWHRRNQYSVENEAMIQENWIWAWILQFQIRQIQGKTTPEETEKVLSYLNAILKKHKKDTLLGIDLNFDPGREESTEGNP
ncbi:MAG TPA: hypothetical protein VLD38_01885 [Nitrosopumilaceae archaeon]|nr:hypothetical protein [Nitrosopumilaceae archaeon]